MTNCTEGRICAWKCIQSIKVHDCLPSYRYSEFYNNPIIWFRITIGMSSTPVQEVLISTLPPPSLLFCLSSAVSPAGPTLQDISLHIQDPPLKTHLVKIASSILLEGLARVSIFQLMFTDVRSRIRNLRSSNDQCEKDKMQHPDLTWPNGLERKGVAPI